MSLFEAIFKHPYATYSRGSLVFLSRWPAEVRLLFTVVLIVLAWRLYRATSSKASARSRRRLLGLRIAQIVLLAFILGAPALRSVNPRRTNVFTAVMVDASRSMAIEDAGREGSELSRLAAALRALSPGDDSGLLSELGGLANVITYRFDSRAGRVGDLAELEPKGGRTNLFRAMRDVDSDLRALPLASVVLLTDGCRNAGGPIEDAAGLFQARGVPVHVVGLGNANPSADYEIVRALAPRRVRRHTEAEVYATIRHTGFAKPFEVTISRAGSPLVTRRVEPTADTDVTSLRLTFTPDHEGAATYEIAVPAAPNEPLTANNSRELVIHVRDDRLPVLYIEGSPRQEYRFLRRALFRDSDFRLVGLLRLAADRFYVQGASDAEQYLSKGFPATPERLFAFQAIILGDIEARHFTRRQLDLMEQFVRERGGGLLMLGGVNSFGLGKYAHTPVGKMLPLAVSEADRGYSDETFTARATPAGLAHPLLRLAPDPDQNRRLWEKAPPLSGITPVSGVKAGASVLLEHSQDRRPVLAAHSYGEGRVAAFTSGGSWYWQVSAPASDQLHEKLWKQLVRWLAAGAKEHLAAEAASSVYSRREAVFVRATALGPDLRPVNDARVVAAVTDPFGNTEEIPMDWVLEQEGVYQCRYVPAEEGDYRVSVRVEGWSVEPAETGFQVSDPLIEFSNASLKETTLREMAEIAAGRYFGLQDAAEVAEEVRRAVKAARFAGIRPADHEIWDTPLLLVLLVALMAAEWFIRRKSGLA